MGNLHQDVEDPDAIWMPAAGVFHLVAIVLCDIEAFVFNLPPKASSFVGDVGGIALREFEVGYPHEIGLLPLRRGLGTEEYVWAEFGNRQGVDPAE